MLALDPMIGNTQVDTTDIGRASGCADFSSTGTDILPVVAYLVHGIHGVSQRQKTIGVCRIEKQNERRRTNRDRTIPKNARLTNTLLRGSSNDVVVAQSSWISLRSIANSQMRYWFMAFHLTREVTVATYKLIGTAV